MGPSLAGQGAPPPRDAGAQRHAAIAKTLLIAAPLVFVVGAGLNREPDGMPCNGPGDGPVPRGRSSPVICADTRSPTS